ncbi:MAG: lipid-A-disaccharide synthase, partial [Rhodospirillaceae bacterium]|nr:lipid-A-disaccharide synthase [Rhodospirillaceae bacterium]
MNDRATDPLVYLIAGEASGDALGANLMAALKSKTGGKVRFVGIGGDLMQNQGLQSLFPMTELSIMGFSEVLPKIPKLLKRISQTTADIIEQKPDVVVSIDAPDFVFRVDKRVKAQAPAIPIVHFVAPSVWAWRPGRAKKISRFVDHLLCLLPFEPPYFAAVGLDAT